MIEEAQTRDLSSDEYQGIARRVMEEHATVVKDIKEKGKEGKVMFLVGQMVRIGGKALVPKKAEHTLREMLELPVKGR